MLPFLGGIFFRMQELCFKICHSSGGQSECRQKDLSAQKNKKDFLRLNIVLITVDA